MFLKSIKTIYMIGTTNNLRGYADPTKTKNTHTQKGCQAREI